MSIVLALCLTITTVRSVQRVKGQVKTAVQPEDYQVSVGQQGEVGASKHTRTHTHIFKLRFQFQICNA